MSMPYSYANYKGSALPANGEVVTIYVTDSTGIHQRSGVHRVLVAIFNDQAGTLKGYQSSDGGATYFQVTGDISVAIATANTDQLYDFLIEPYKDYKITWTNGVNPQTTFRVNIACLGERVVAN